MEVSSKVSLGVSREAAPAERPERSRGKATCAGRYLVRSGSIYLFQIKVPRDLCGGAPSPVRVSLGALTARQARIRADLMAAHARHCFDRMRARRLADNRDRNEDDGSGSPQFSGETQGEALAEVRGYLRAVASFVSPEPPPTPPHQETAFEGMRGLVGIARELAKGSAGNPVIVENAELLKARYVEKFSSGGTSEAATIPPASQAMAPAAGGVSAAPVLPGAVVTNKPGPAAAPKIPAFQLDRRFVERPRSSKPLFSTVSDEYLAARRTKSGDDNADVETARFRRDLFIELIGDHPVDTYTGTDLQAYVSLLKYWPALVGERPPGMGAREIIAANQDLSRKPLGIKSLREGYVANIKAMFRSKLTEHDYRDPFSGAKIFYPETAAPSQATEPAGARNSSRKRTVRFRVGSHKNGPRKFSESRPHCGILHRHIQHDLLPCSARSQAGSSSASSSAASWTP